MDAELRAGCPRHEGTPWDIASRSRAAWCRVPASAVLSSTGGNNTNNDRFREFALCYSHHPGGEGEGRKKEEEEEDGEDEVPPFYI